ncbi:uncharacterized protein [Cicer arietinum]|uniref:Uncharacterized protein LOC101500795 n=1 Tax=Cicer arietinum TaxID=3827 RepID=A0A1S2XI81_CICAR|nr:uncharacterized protein LOC101500795 [Cicer arietinum]
MEVSTSLITKMNFITLNVALTYAGSLNYGVVLDLHDYIQEVPGEKVAPLYTTVLGKDSSVRVEAEATVRVGVTVVAQGTSGKDKGSMSVGRDIARSSRRAEPEHLLLTGPSMDVDEEKVTSKRDTASDGTCIMYGVFEIVQEGYEQLGSNPTKRQQAAFKDCKKRDDKTLFYIQQSVDSNNFEKISKASTSNKAWDILVKYYTGGGNAKKLKLQMLRRKYELLQIEEDEIVADYFNRVREIINQMRTNGEPITEVVIVENILRTLTQRYGHIVVVIEESKHPDKMLKLARRSVKMMGSTRKETENSSGTRSMSLMKGAGSSRNQQNNECISKKVQRDDDEAQLVQADDSNSDEVLFMAATGTKDDCLELWYLDTRCSNHMTEHKEWFVIIDKKVKREIKFIDNITMTTEGVGKVLIQRRDDKQSFICDVWYVPNMKNNLLSLGQLLEKGYSMNMENGQMKMFESSKRLVLKTPLSKNITFKMEIQISENQCLATEVRSEDWLWHQRFGHLNFRSLQML